MPGRDLSESVGQGAGQRPQRPTNGASISRLAIPKLEFRAVHTLSRIEASDIPFRETGRNRIRWRRASQGRVPMRGRRPRCRLDVAAHESKHRSHALREMGLVGRE